MVELILTYIITLQESTLANLHYSPLIGLALVFVLIIIQIVSKTHYPPFYHKLINILLILSFFNIIIITFFYQLIYILNVLFSYNVSYFLNLPLINLCISPFIIYYKQTINTYILSFIIKFSYNWGAWFDIALNYFFTRFILSFMYFITLSGILFTLDIYLGYLIVSLFLFTCLFIIKSPYYFELLDSPLINDNLSFFLNNLEKIKIDYPKSIATTLLFFVINQGNNVPKRFIHYTKPNLGFFEEITKATSELTKPISPEKMRAYTLLVKEHPRQVGIVFGITFVPFSTLLAYRAYKTKLSHDVTISNNSVKLAEISLERDKLQLEQLKLNASFLNTLPASSSSTTIVSPPSSPSDSTDLAQCFEVGDNTSSFIEFIILLFF